MGSPDRFLSCFGLFLARFCVSAWVGAAVLFVIVGVMEVTRGGFDSPTKDSLVALRFPAFYIFGATLLCLGWIGTWIVGASDAFPRRRRMSALGLLAVVMAFMLVDYIWIYQPLLQMVTPAGQLKPSHFQGYHQASKWVNIAGLAISFAVSLVLNWPVRRTNDFESRPRNELH